MAAAQPGTLLASLHNSAAAHPQRVAFTFEGRQTGFAAFARHAGQVAAALRAAGIGPGERIAYIGKNSDIFFEALFGAMKAGVVMVPVNWRLAGPEIAAIVEDCKARLILVGPEFSGLVEAERAAMTRVEIIVATQGGHATWPDFAAWRDGQPPSEQDHPASPGDVAVQLYTSGTTGRPKGVMLSHANFVHVIEENARNPAAWTQWKDGDSAIQAMPVSHISGTGWGIITVHQAATCHIQRQFDIELTLDMILRDRINKIFLVPAAMQFLVRHPRARDVDFSCIREMGYGASPIPLALLRECMDVLGCGFVQFYGMTETTGTIVALAPEDHVPEGSPRMRAAGKPLPWVQIRVVDANGQDVTPGQVGEIITRSPANMVGYWERPEETARTIRDGWLHTGDAGYVDEDGYVFIHDRVKDMIISGGENVYPAEVESALSEHPAVADVAVIGIPDEKWGEAVTAVVVLRPDAQLTADELMAWSRQRIAGFKTPRRVSFVEVLPRNASGKLLKRELRAPYWAGEGRQVN
jgi:acyl-CoA synthetase (AMP-forming)/AMP-acid ligase II